MARVLTDCAVRLPQEEADPEASYLHCLEAIRATAATVASVPDAAVLVDCPAACAALLRAAGEGGAPTVDEAIRQSSKQRLRVAVVGSANLLRVAAEHRAAVAAFAEELGRLLAESGFLVVTGGMGGVMEAACRGARRASGAGGLVTLGLLPWASSAGANNFVDVPLPTGLQEARNNLVALADAVVGVAGGGGTLSEMAYAWSSRRLVIAARGPGIAGKLADTSPDDRRDGVIHGVDLDRPQDAAAIIFNERLSLYGRQQAPGGIQAA